MVLALAGLLLSHGSYGREAELSELTSSVAIWIASRSPTIWALRVELPGSVRSIRSRRGIFSRTEKLEGDVDIVLATHKRHVFLTDLDEVVISIVVHAS
jgi:hypothetical protein